MTCDITCLSFPLIVIGNADWRRKLISIWIGCRANPYALVYIINSIVNFDLTRGVQDFDFQIPHWYRCSLKFCRESKLRISGNIIVIYRRGCTILKVKNNSLSIMEHFDCFGLRRLRYVQYLFRIGPEYLTVLSFSNGVDPMRWRIHRIVQTTRDMPRTIGKASGLGYLDIIKIDFYRASICGSSTNHKVRSCRLVWYHYWKVESIERCQTNGLPYSLTIYITQKISIGYTITSCWRNGTEANNLRIIR